MLSEPQRIWTGSWSVASGASPPLIACGTVRTVVRLTAGGEYLRVRFSDQYGRTPLTIGAVRVGTKATVKMALFDGTQNMTLLPGASAVSDAVNLETSANSDLVISVFYPEQVPQELTLHPDILGAGERNSFIPGNAVDDMNAAVAFVLDATYFLAGIEVQHPASRGTVIALGDSITDGGAGRWPTLFAQRLLACRRDYGVLNAGISGNRLLRHDRGFWGQVPSARERFHRDVLAQPEVRYVILSVGINDVINANHEPSQGVATCEITESIAALRRCANEHGIKLYTATLTPFEGIATPDFSKKT